MAKWAQKQRRWQLGAFARLSTTGRGGQPEPDMGSTATLGPSLSRTRGWRLGLCFLVLSLLVLLGCRCKQVVKAPHRALG